MPDPRYLPDDRETVFLTHKDLPNADPVEVAAVSEDAYTRRGWKRASKAAVARATEPASTEKKES